MFKSSRVKIILSIMGSLLILFAITLSVILLASYREIRNNNSEKLERYADLFLLNSQSQDQAPPEPNSESKSEQRTNQTPPDSKPENRPENNAEQRQRKDNAPIEERSDYQLSTFYSVAFSKDNEVLEVDDGDKDVYEKDELVEIAKQVLEKNKDEGQIGELAFVVRTRPGYTLVAFLDNTFANSSMDMLIRNFLIVGTSALVVLFFISLFISKLIIRPLAENDKRQKQFISDASHELKTPISVISANADMLSREIGDNEWLSNIQYENERMGTLVRQLLDLSRAENAEIPMEQIDLSRVVAGDALAFESLAYDNGRTISSNIEENIHVMGNRTQLEQLV
ncbi:MAG: HAMP domain-containing histidine kinase, partial [Spirochaetales bacterium]|nr:HAMP domain-containing histidine kinase [Spirochaetales bacterium]